MYLVKVETLSTLILMVMYQINLVDGICLNNGLKEH